MAHFTSSALSWTSSSECSTSMGVDKSPSLLVSPVLVPQPQPNNAPTKKDAFQVPQSLQHLIELIHQELGADKGLDSADVDVPKIRALMTAYESKEEDWAHFALWDKSKNYTRNLVDDGNGKYFNLMILCWNEGKSSPIHDHAGAHCIMKVLDGKLTETQYDWPSNPSPPCSGSSMSDSDSDESGQTVPSSKRMTVKCETTLSRNEATYIHDKIGLHRVSNKTDKPAISLHLYTPAYETCKTFDETNGTCHRSSRCVFFSKGGVRIPLSECSLTS